MNKAQELIEKYNLVTNSYYTESPYSKEFQETETAKENYEKGYKRSQELNEKWKGRIPKGYYGFDLGYPVPSIFYNVVDEFLEYAQKECPNLEIYQIKQKFSDIRIYLGNINERVEEELYKLTAAMGEKFLTY